MIYEKAPTDFNPRFEIVSCYLENDGKFLLLHRHEHKSQANKWGVAAGKVEERETAGDAMVREIKEETGLDVPQNRLEYFTKVYVRHAGYDFVYHIFRTKLDVRPEIKINEHEHKDFQWVLPSDGLQMNLVDDLGECMKLFYKITG